VPVKIFNMVLFSYNAWGVDGGIPNDYVHRDMCLKASPLDEIR